MSKPTEPDATETWKDVDVDEFMDELRRPEPDAVERAKAFLIANALMPLPELAAKYADEQVAAYRERLRAKVEGMPNPYKAYSTVGVSYDQAKAKVLELIDGELK